MNESFTTSLIAANGGGPGVRLRRPQAGSMSAIEITRQNLSISQLRAAAARTADAKQTRRILAIAMVLDGLSRLLAVKPRSGAGFSPIATSRPFRSYPPSSPFTTSRILMSSRRMINRQQPSDPSRQLDQAICPLQSLRQSRSGADSIASCATRQCCRTLRQASARQARSQLVAGSAPMNKKTLRIARSVSCPGRSVAPAHPFEPAFGRARERDDFGGAQKLDIRPRFDALDQIARHRRSKAVGAHEH